MYYQKFIDALQLGKHQQWNGIYKSGEYGIMVYQCDYIIEECGLVDDEEGYIQFKILRTIINNQAVFTQKSEWSCINNGIQEFIYELLSKIIDETDYKNDNYLHEMPLVVVDKNNVELVTSEEENSKMEWGFISYSTPNLLD